jgi:hypothetical protein
MCLNLPGAWDSPTSKKIAGDISSIAGLYCGPAAVGWIAAIWNNLQGRSYDYKGRLKDKALFPDGPRPFSIKLPGFQKSLNDLLMRETNNELKLSTETYYRHKSIDNILSKDDMPVIIRMLALKPAEGLHYVTAYKSETHVRNAANDQIQFYLQDNGVYGSNAANAGLSKLRLSDTRANIFLWGAKRVVKI